MLAPDAVVVGMLVIFQRNQRFDLPAVANEFVVAQTAAGILRRQENPAVVDHSLDRAAAAHVGGADGLAVDIPEALADRSMADKRVAEEPERFVA